MIYQSIWTSHNYVLVNANSFGKSFTVVQFCGGISKMVGPLPKKNNIILPYEAKEEYCFILFVLQMGEMEFHEKMLLRFFDL